MAKEASLAKQMGEALARLPVGEYVTLRPEESEDGEPFLAMVLFQEAPEDGWATEGDHFGQPPDSPRHQIPCPEAWKHEARCIFGVSGDPEHPKVFIRNVIAALQRHLEKKDDGAA